MAGAFYAGYHRILRRILILVILLIIYGSLYPWHFAAVHLAANPFWLLLHSWRPEPLRYFVRDVAVNVALYIPLGFSAHLVFQKSRLPGFSIYGPVALGLALSTAMELVQFLTPTRNTNIADVITNIIGSGLGVMTALLFEALASPVNADTPRYKHEYKIVDRGALLLAFCWAAWLFFPLFPVMSRVALRGKLAVFEHSQLMDPVLLVSTAAVWYAGGLLLAAAGIQISRGRFAFTLLAIPAQFFIVERQPLPSLVLGGIAGVVLFALRDRKGVTPRLEAWAFFAVIAFRGLSPFYMVPGAAPFHWIPFEATLGGDWQSAADILIEKVFYYGTAIWMLRAAGFRWVRSILVVSAMLLCIEILQIHMPGRTPETTDPILAALVGFVLAMLSRPAGAESQ